MKKEVNTATKTSGRKISNLFYKEEGKGETTLIFIHGLGSSHEVWERNISFLKEYARCISIDLPGYGQSSRGFQAVSMSSYSEKVEGLIRQLKLENVMLAGHSMGGQVAQTIALRQKVAIQKLVLIAPAGFETFSPFEKNWLKTFYLPPVVLTQTEEQIKKNFSKNFYRPTEEVEKFLKKRLALRRNVPAYASYAETVTQCVRAMLDEPVFNRLEEIAVPTLIIFGKQDQLIPNRLFRPEGTAEEIARTGHEAIPESKLILLEECGHFAQLEKAETINTEILQFLDAGEKAEVERSPYPLSTTQPIPSRKPANMPIWKKILQRLSPFRN